MEITDEKIQKSSGFKKLHKAIIDDAKCGWSLKDRMAKLHFAVERANHYEQKTGIPASKILNAWESRRNYWYMNYYQDSNQPLIEGESVKVFATKEELHSSIGNDGFRCPNCDGISKDPYVCNSRIQLPIAKSKKLYTCDWKVYGLFGDLGKGVYVFVSSEVAGENIFKPVAWEAKDIKQLENPK